MKILRISQTVLWHNLWCNAQVIHDRKVERIFGLLCSTWYPIKDIAGTYNRYDKWEQI